MPEISQLTAKQSNPPIQNDRLLRRPIVEGMTGLPTSSLYDMMRQGRFPQPIKLSERSVAWRESEVTAWMSARLENNLVRQVVEVRPEVRRGRPPGVRGGGGARS